MLLLVGAAACPGPAHRQEALVDRDPLCQLVAGEVAAWTGLPARTTAALPACLGPRTARSATRFGGSLLLTDHHRPAPGVDVWIHAAASGGAIVLIEVRRAPALDGTAWTGALGAPEATHRWGPDEHASAAAVTGPVDASVVDELVWGRRGLAVAVDHDRPAAVVRWRGFAPSTATAYLGEFVDVAPTPP